MRFKFLTVYLFTVLLLIPVQWARGQAVTGTIVGTATDESGAVVPGAQIVGRNVETGIARTLMTNDVGQYSVPFLSPGTYTVEADHTGFRKWVRENIIVQVASTVRVDVQLRVGSVAQKFEVSAQAPLLQTEGAQIASVLGERQLRELPSLDRSYQDMVSLLPGTGRPVQNFTDIGDDDTRLTSVNGLERYSNNYQIDGVDNNDAILGNTFQVPPIESIQEVDVETSNYDAEFGRAGGAVVNVQTRGGSNQLRGTAYYFHRDTFLRARRALPFEESPPRSVRNQYGATLGGPIIKNRTFFFGDFEGTNLREAQTQILSVPIPEFRNGDFSAVLGEPLGVLDPAGQEVYSGSLFDPATGDADGLGRLVFPGNIIDSFRFSPQAKKILDMMPMPNVPDALTENYSVRVPTPRDTYNFDARVDHLLTPSTNLFVKFNFKNTHAESFSSVGAALRPDGFLNGDGHLRAQNTTFNLTKAFGPSTVAEFRFGVNRLRYTFKGLNQRTAEEFGIQGFDPGTPLPLMYFYDGSVTNVGFYPYYPLVNEQTTFQWSTTWTKATGKHNLKWGADVRQMRLMRESRSSNTGTFFFYNYVTRGFDDQYVDSLEFTEGSTISSFLLGLPDSVQRNQLLTPPRDRGNQFFLFGQDSWRATKKLTLNLGLRWELYAPVTAPEPGGAANYDPATGRVLLAGLGDVSASAGVKTYYRNYAPRVGFAYQLNDKTVFRGGYGISYTVHPFGGYGALLSVNFPNVSVQTAGILGDGIPQGTLAQMIPVQLPEVPSSGIIDPAPPDQFFYALPFDAKFPYIQSYNVTLQRELLPDLSLDVGYVGNRGVNLWAGYNELNYSPPGSGDDGGALFRKFGFASSASQVQLDANSIYNSLQVNLKKRFAHGLAFTTAYTWQRGIGYIHGPLFPAEFRHLGRGVDTNNQQLVVSHLLESPFGPEKPFLKKGPLSQVLRGWQYSGILTLYSGPPFSVYANPSRLDGVRLSRNHPDLLGPPVILGNTGPGELYFDTSVFAEPPIGVYGNAGAQLLYAPGRVNYDVSLIRRFGLGEDRELELRAEFFNVANTPHWGIPENNIDRPRFGEILSDANDARRAQFALRLRF